MKKNPFKCMEHGFVDRLDNDSLEPVETVSACIYCGNSVAVTVWAGKITELIKGA